MSELAPTSGVRVLLELASSGETGAVYRVELHAPEASWQSLATVTLASGALGMEDWSRARGQGEPEAWMIDSARAFLRTLHKNHAAERSWPRRQLRWRERKG